MHVVLEEHLQAMLGETRAPALAAIVVGRSAVLAQAAVGVRRLGRQTPVTLADRFHTGSNAKAMTAALCAALVHEKQLSWEMTPLDTFPDLSSALQPAYRSITLEMLLRHHAGIAPYTDDEAADFVLPDRLPANREEHIAQFSRWLLATIPPINEPGTAFSYSNAGYSIASAMAEEVTGSRWARLLQQKLFEPLAMEAVAGRGWPASDDETQPWGHLVRGEGLIPHPPDDAYQLEPFLAPAGDVCLSLPNYGRFLQAQLLGPEAGGAKPFLPAALISRLHNDGQPGVGMGWGVTRLRSMEHLGLFSTHAGSAGTFVMVAAVAHERDLAVALAANAGIDEGLSAGFKRIIARFALEV